RSVRAGRRGRAPWSWRARRARRASRSASSGSDPARKQSRKESRRDPHRKERRPRKSLQSPRRSRSSPSPSPLSPSFLGSRRGGGAAAGGIDGGAWAEDATLFPGRPGTGERSASGIPLRRTLLAVSRFERLHLFAASELLEHFSQRVEVARPALGELDGASQGLDRLLEALGRGEREPELQVVLPALGTLFC